MRKGRFSEEQMVAIIREADRDPVAAVAKRHGISEQTIYTWRKRFGGLQASDVPDYEVGVASGLTRAKIGPFSKTIDGSAEEPCCPNL